MKFHFKISGGFGGLKYELDDDTANLPKPYGETLESLVNGTSTFTKKAANSLARDVFRYDLDVQDTAKPFSVHFDDTDMPAGLEDLFSYLRQAAFSAKKK